MFIKKFIQSINYPSFPLYAACAFLVAGIGYEKGGVYGAVFGSFIGIVSVIGHTLQENRRKALIK